MRPVHSRSAIVATPTLSALLRRKHDSHRHRDGGAVKAEAAQRARDRARLDGVDDPVHPPTNSEQLLHFASRKNGSLRSG